MTHSYEKALEIVEEHFGKTFPEATEIKDRSDFDIEDRCYLINSHPVQ